MIFFFGVACEGGRKEVGCVVKLLIVSINVAGDAGIQGGKKNSDEIIWIVYHKLLQEHFLSENYILLFVVNIQRSL